MKRVLQLSLLLNAASLTAVAFLLTYTGPVGGTHSPPMLRATSAPKVAFRRVQLPPVTLAFGGFSWRQIESTDYGIYLANLRAIGCPEQTIADILRADVHALYAKKRADLALPTQLAEGAWSPAEENHVITTLLGLSAKRETRERQMPGRTPVLPLVLHELDPHLLQLDEDQQAALAELREQFIRDVGGANQDPGDPAYAQRWQQAQPESDRLLKGMIGVNAFMRYQNEAQ